MQLARNFKPDHTKKSETKKRGAQSRMGQSQGSSSLVKQHQSRGGCLLEDWPLLQYLLSSSLTLQDLGTLCRCSKALRGQPESKVSHFARRIRLHNETSLARWTGAMLLDLGVVSEERSRVWIVDLASDVAMTVSSVKAGLSLLAVGMDFGFFRHGNVRDVDGGPLSFHERRHVKFLGASRIHGKLHRDSEGNVDLSCAALCILETSAGPRVGLAKFHLVNLAYDLSGISVHRTSLVTASRIADLRDDDGGRHLAFDDDDDDDVNWDPSNGDFGGVGSPAWLKSLRAYAYDCPRKFFRLIDSRVDAWLQTFAAGSSQST